MTDQLQILRAEIEEDIAEAERQVHRLNDRLGVLRHVLARVRQAQAEPTDPAPTPAEPERREKRDIRGTVLAILTERGTPMSAPMIRSLVEQRIGELTDSALARSLTSLVGDGKVVERDGVFSLPPPATETPAVSKLGIGFLTDAEAAQ
ncbi:MAG TPA: hypothetical protein VN663_23105 [Ramlibacter sp.]|nr:hypothetical protein [Ramlibacter sp.]